MFLIIERKGYSVKKMDHLINKFGQNMNFFYFSFLHNLAKWQNVKYIPLYEGREDTPGPAAGRGRILVGPAEER